MQKFYLYTLAFLQINATTNIAVYASICKHLNLPFTFPGGRTAFMGQLFWNVSDAELVAEHLIWEATTKEAANQVICYVDNCRVEFLKLFFLCSLTKYETMIP